MKFQKKLLCTSTKLVTICLIAAVYWKLKYSLSKQTATFPNLTHVNSEDSFSGIEYEDCVDYKHQQFDKENTKYEIILKLILRLFIYNQ